MSKVILFTYLLLHSYIGWAQWDLKLEKEGIKVLTRKVIGSSIKEFKASLLINSTPDSILEILTDYSHYTDWVDKFKRGELLDYEPPSTYYLHFEIKVPFPLSDRDIVQSMNIQSIPDGYFIEVKSHPGYIPEQDDFIRMKSEGHWRILKKDDGSTFVEMQFHNDPMGYIPNWIINNLIIRSPVNTLKGLRRKAKDVYGYE